MSLRYFSYFACVLTFLVTANATAHGSETTSGDLNALVNFMYSGKAKQAKNFKLISHGREIGLHVRAYRSTMETVDPNDNRCTADAQARRISCDLSLLTSLSSRFRYPGEKQPRRTRDSIVAEKKMLKWIVAHEVGHIELGHGESDWEDPPKGFLIFDNANQRLELDADRYAIKLIGNLENASADYAFLMGISSSLIAQSLCPKTYPCENLHVGVGLIYNSQNSEPIKISGGGSHPDFVARFVRLLYLSGEGTGQQSLNYMAKRVIEKLVIEKTAGEWVTAEDALINR